MNRNRKTRYILLLFFIMTAAVTTYPSKATAADYWPPDDPRWIYQAFSPEGEEPELSTQRDLLEYLLWKDMLDVVPDEGEYYIGETYIETMNEAAAFIATLQVSDPDTITYGGMREGEDMLDIIQTDNTQESIWVWSRYHTLTGETTYDENVQAAWEYVMNFPAYNEEGGTGNIGYYRVYNCGWALWAVMGYEQAYGDTSFRSYADSCATYIMSYPLDLYSSIFPYYILSGMVESWAVGSLYHYGAYLDDTGIKQAAAQMGAEIKGWVETNPGRGLGRENWAMSGGATMWGLLNSYFSKRPDLVADWLDTYTSYMKLFDDSGDFNAAHNLWYALGHQAVWETTGSSQRKVNHRLLVEAMMGLDTDDDGGIPASTDDPNTTDQSWVTNYLSFMGFDVLVPPGDITVKPEQFIVSAGGVLSTTVSLANNEDVAVTYTSWIDVDTPYGPYGGNPILGPIDVTVSPWEVLSLPIHQIIPAFAPPGLYRYRASLDTGGEVVDVSEFPFYVVSGRLR